MKKKKAAEDDKIPYKAWIYEENKRIEDLYAVLNEIWKGNVELLEEWRTGIVTPLHKKGIKQGTLKN